MPVILPYSAFLFVWKWNLTKLAWLGTIDMTSVITATTVNKRWKGLSWWKSFPAPQEWWVWHSRHNIRRWGPKNRYFQPRVETLNFCFGGEVGRLRHCKVTATFCNPSLIWGTTLLYTTHTWNRNWRSFYELLCSIELYPSLNKLETWLFLVKHV